MAILQESNAVFYHPLDNSTEFLQAQAWTGTGDFPAAKVSQGLAGVVDIDSFGAATKFINLAQQNTQTWDISAARLSPTTFVVAYRDDGDGSHGKAKVGTVSGTDITFGAERTWQNNLTTFISVAVLSPTTFVVAYSSSGGRAQVGTVTGTDIAMNAIVNYSFVVGVATHTAVAALSSTTFVVAYKDNSDSNHGTAKVGTVSGTVITYGVESEFLSAGSVISNSVVVLSPTTFVVAYTDVSNGDAGTAKFGTVSGTDITFGAATALGG